MSEKTRKILKTVLIVFVVLSLVGTTLVYVDNQEIKIKEYPRPTEHFFVEDYSGVLNESTERYIFDEAVRLFKKTKAQVVVVTVPDLMDESLEDYSIHLANSWGIGDAELDNGILLLFDTEEPYPHVRLEVGKGLEGAITDGMAGRILDDNAVEEKEKGLWNKAAGNTFTEIVKRLYDEYGLKPPKDLAKKEDWGDGTQPTEGTFGDAVIPEIRYEKNTAPFLKQVATAFLDFWSFMLLVFLFLGLVAIAILAAIFGGGSDSSGSSSGGGGGGGFSGGGGSFGGGGASR